MPSIEVPVLALRGARDQYGTEAQTEAIPTRARAGRAVTIADSGHSSHLDQSVAVLELMKRFVLAA